MGGGGGWDERVERQRANGFFGFCSLSKALIQKTTGAVRVASGMGEFLIFFRFVRVGYGVARNVLVMHA